MRESARTATVGVPEDFQHVPCEQLRRERHDLQLELLQLTDDRSSLPAGSAGGEGLEGLGNALERLGYRLKRREVSEKILRTRAALLAMDYNLSRRCR